MAVRRGPPAILRVNRDFAPDILWAVTRGGQRSFTPRFLPSAFTGTVKGSSVGPAIETPTNRFCSQSGEVLTTSNGAGTGDFTLFVYARPPSGGDSTDRGFVGQGTGVIPIGGLLTLNLSSTGSIGVGDIAFWTYDGGQSALCVSGLVTGNWLAIGGVRRGTSHGLWVDGTVRMSSTETVRDITASEPSFTVGGYPGNGYPIIGPMAIAAGWNRALSDAELAALGSDPWLLFERPRRRVWVPVPYSYAGPYYKTRRIGGVIDNAAGLDLTALILRDQ